MDDNGQQIAELGRRPTGDIWSLEQVATYIQMSEDWVYDHATRRNPRIRAIRLGGQRAKLRFRSEDVDNFILEHLTGGVE